MGNGSSTERTSESSTLSKFTSFFTGSSGGQPNPLYPYTADDIQVLLNLRIRVFTNVHVLAAVNLSDIGIQNGNNIVNVLTAFLDTNQGKSRDFLRILIPILVNEDHWVGICLTIDEDKQPYIIYFNSLIRNSAYQAVPERILEEVNTVLTSKNIKQARLKICPDSLQQPDLLSCGPFLIENLYCYLRLTWWPSDTANLADVIRHKHMNLLRTGHEKYYRIFEASQFGNASEAEFFPNDRIFSNV